MTASLPPPDQTLRRAYEQALADCGIGRLTLARLLASVAARHGKIVDGHLDRFALDTFAAALLRETGDARFGLRMGRAMADGATGVLEYAMYTSDDLAQALEVYRRYGRLVDEYIHFDVAECAGYVTATLIAPNDLPLHPLLADYRLYRVLHAVRRAFDDASYEPSGAYFNYPAPDDLTPYREAFGARAELHFDAPHPALRLLESDTRRSLPKRDPQLRHILVCCAEQLLEESPEPTSIKGRLKRLLTAQLHEGRPSLSEAARNLGLSERTLRRRLKDEGTGFADVLDDLRMRKLRALIDAHGQDEKAVAARLGFQSVRALRRAQQRWQRDEGESASPPRE